MGQSSPTACSSRAREELTETAQTRLESLVAITDGFELAEIDLDLRGGGQLLGTRQHGVSDLRFAASASTGRCSSGARRGAGAR